jgi:hypothetical protein
MSRWMPVPINRGMTKNVDGLILDNESSELQDGYIDEKGAFNRRFGLTAQDESFGNGFTHGEYEWKRKGWYMFVQGGQLYKKTAIDDAPVSMGGVLLEFNTEVTFADNGTYLVMANGGRMVYTNGTDAPAYIADADAPTTVSHVAHIDGYIIANDVGTDNVYISDLDDALNWDSANFFNAESIPDTVEAVHVADSLIYAFGPTTLEVWYNAGLSGGVPFERQQVIERGIIAKYSVVRANNTFYWLNEERRLVFLNGGLAQSVSVPFDRVLHDMEVVSDCISSLVAVDGRYFIMLNFDNDDKTLIYDIGTNQWYTWGYWNRHAYERVLMHKVTYMQAWGKYLAGSRKDDTIFTLSRTVYQDDGDEMRSLNQTGWIDHGTSVVKKSKRLRIKVKRGAVDLGIEVSPTLILQHRTNGDLNWSNERELDLGAIGETEQYVYVNRLGLYRNRQYRFILTDNAPLVLVSVEENIEAGRD